MENCVIYSHKPEFENILQIVKATLPNAKVEHNDGGIQQSLVATIKGGFWGKPKILTINYRQRINPSFNLDQIECGLTQNLAGMVSFIQSLPAENEGIRNKFLFKVMSANCEIPFIAEPEITPEFETVLRKILQDMDGFIFATPSKFFQTSNGQHFLDKNLHLILDVHGNCAIQDIDIAVDAKYHDQPAESYSEAQKSRKAKSEAFLKTHLIKVNANLPCVPSDEEVVIRSASEIIDRAYALLIIAVKGEGIEQQHLAKTVEAKKIDSFSPRETYVYGAESLDDGERAYATWRYESLYTMLRALGLVLESRILTLDISQNPPPI